MEPKELAILAARLIDDMKAENIQVLDVREICNFTNFFVLATATSSPQLRAVAQHVQRRLRERGERPISGGDIDTSTWIALDYYDVVVHIMSAEARDYYNIESLWQDAETVEWFDPSRSKKDDRE